MKSCRLSFWLPSSLSLLLFTASPLKAQIVPDRTLPNPSSVNIINGSTSVITGGTKAGVNLLHSFQEFSVPNSGAASFQGIDRGIENVISRVTGTSVSNINGLIQLLQTDGSTSAANFFLLNPNGIVFGRGATLNVGGSFLATTASSLSFADGSHFSTTSPQITVPLLTISVPIGLQFGQPVRSIQLQGARLQVPLGKTLGLVGGDLTLSGGTLTASGGRIELGSVAGVTPVSLNLNNQGWSLGYGGVQNFQDIQLSQGTIVSASGTRGGDIQIQGRDIKLTDDSRVVTNTQRADAGGNLTVNASSSVELIGNSTGERPSGLFTQVNQGATGKGGDLTITTPKLIVRDGAQVNATTNGMGNAGNLTIRASDVELVGVAKSPGGTHVTNERGLPFPSGLFAGTGLDSQGSGGNLTVVSDRLSLQDGAVVQTSTLSRGDAGNLTIKASESVELSGTSPGIRFPSSLLAVSGGISGFPGVFEATGKGGNLDLEVGTGQLRIRDGAAIAVSSINLNAKGAGNIIITSPIIRLENQGAITAETASGRGGDIALRSQDILLLRDRSRISTTAGTAGAGGNGGNITISRPFLVSPPLENNDITANAFSGQGGSVTINAQGIFGLEPKSRQDLEQRLATTDFTQLKPDRLQTNDITAISQENPNLNGRVTINTPDVDPSRGLVALPSGVVDATRLIVSSSCAAFAGEEGSTFVITGSGGLPPNPYDVLSSDVIWEDARLPILSEQKRDQVVPAPHTSTTDVAPIVPAQGWVFNQKGEVTLIAKEPNSNPQSFGFTPAFCHRSGG